MRIMTDEEFMTLSIDEAEKHIQKRIDPQAAAAMETMIDSFSMQNDPHVGCFWYDTNTNSLFGVDAPLARDVPYYFFQEYNQNIKTGHMLHKKIWQKYHFRGQDSRFNGDFKQVPRGRVFEFENDGFVVFTGSWIKDYPEAKEAILFEFELDPKKTSFRIDHHWDIGQSWGNDANDL